MPTFELIVEGEYDAVVLAELSQKCAGGNIDVIHRICGSKSQLMKRFRGFLEEFHRVKQGTHVDRALVVRDSDKADPEELIERMEVMIAGRSYPFPVRLVIVVRELETWLLADNEAISQTIGRPMPEINGPLEGILDPKQRLQTILSNARIAYTKAVARKIAAATDLEKLAYRCPSFRIFRQAVEGR
jgi:hypothetical protein